MLDACAAQQEQLDEAKAAYEADPTPEREAALNDAMRAMYEFRGWVRSIARLRAVRAELVGLPEDHERRPGLEAELADLEHRYGAFAADLEALAGPDLPPGSVHVTPQPVRAKGRIKRPGGA